MDLNYLKQEPGLAQLIKKEPALLLKEDILEVSKQDGNEQQYVQDTSTPAGTGSVKEAGSMNLDNMLNVKCELVDLEVRPTVPQHMDKHYIINKNTNAEHTEENTIVDDYNKPRPCSGIKKKSIEDNLRVAADITYKCDKCLRAFQSKVKLKYHHQRMHEIESHRCTECKKEFKCREYLRNHLNHTHSKYQFECAICKIICKTRQTLARHYSRMHKTADKQHQLYRCDKCLKAFDSKSHRNRHWNRIHGSESYKCTQCNKEFKCKTYLVSHVRHIHSKEKYECDICKKTYSTPEAVRFHVSRIHHNSSTVATMEHGASEPVMDQAHLEITMKAEVEEAAPSAAYIDNDADVNHLKQEPGLVQFVESEPPSLVQEESLEDSRQGSCKQQEVEMKDSGVCRALKSLELRLHKDRLDSTCRVHLKRLDAFPCDLCDAVYIENCSLLQHLQSVHKSHPKTSLFVKFYKTNIQQRDADRKNRNYHCDKCSKTFLFKSGLKSHCQTIHGTKYYKCQKCDREFKCVRYLGGHINNMHGNRQYECDICKKIFNYKKSSSKQHQRYRCDKCLKAFKSKFLRNIHWKRIHGSESHKCTQCNKEFKCKTYLVSHVRHIHSKEKYECDICKKTYTTPGTLRLHVSRFHHNRSTGRNYRCDKCMKTFPFESALKAHSLKMHGTECYKCAECNREFKCMSYLRYHINYMHRNKQYECDICKKIFKSKRNLAQHIVGRHSHLVSGADEHQNVPVTSTRAILGSTSVAADSVERVQLLHIKEELEDTDLDIGPAVLQHMDSHYRNYQVKVEHVKMESSPRTDELTVKNEPDLSIKEEITGD